jgi:hypothetical protein
MPLPTSPHDAAFHVNRHGVLAIPGLLLLGVVLVGMPAITMTLTLRLASSLAHCSARPSAWTGRSAAPPS